MWPRSSQPRRPRRRPRPGRSQQRKQVPISPASMTAERAHRRSGDMRRGAKRDPDDARRSVAADRKQRPAPVTPGATPPPTSPPLRTHAHRDAGRRRGGGPAALEPPQAAPGRVALRRPRARRRRGPGNRRGKYSPSSPSRRGPRVPAPRRGRRRLRAGVAARLRASRASSDLGCRARRDDEPPASPLVLRPGPPAAFVERSAPWRRARGGARHARGVTPPSSVDAEAGTRRRRAPAADERSSRRCPGDQAHGPRRARARRTHPAAVAPAPNRRRTKPVRAWR